MKPTQLKDWWIDSSIARFGLFILASQRIFFLIFLYFFFLKKNKKQWKLLRPANTWGEWQLNEELPNFHSTGFRQRPAGARRVTLYSEGEVTPHLETLRLSVLCRNCLSLIISLNGGLRPVYTNHRQLPRCGKICVASDQQELLCPSHREINEFPAVYGDTLSDVSHLWHLGCPLAGCICTN